MDDTTATTAIGDGRCYDAVRSGVTESQYPKLSSDSQASGIRELRKSFHQSSQHSAWLALASLAAVFCLFSAGPVGASSAGDHSAADPSRSPKGILGWLFRLGSGDPTNEQTQLSAASDATLEADLALDSSVEPSGAVGSPQDGSSDPRTQPALKTPEAPVDPVVAAVDERIRLEALRQLDLLDLDDLDARIEPLWALSSGLTNRNGDGGDVDFGFLDLPPTTLDDTSREGGAPFGEF